MKQLEKYPIITIIIGILGISASAILVRLSEAPSVIVAAYRLTWTTILMTPYVWANKIIRKELLQMNRKTFWLSVLSGIFLSMHFVWWFESLVNTTIASASVIVSTEVIWVALGFCMFMKGRLSKKAILAILITLFGSVMVAWSDSQGVGGHLYGDFLALIAALAVAVYTLIGRVAREKTSTTVYTYVVYTTSAVVLCVWAGIQNGTELIALEPRTVLVGFLLAVCSTLLGHSMFSWSLKYFSPAFVSASKLCEPVIAAIAAIFLFHEIPGILQIIGGSIILGGVIYYSKIESEER